MTYQWSMEIITNDYNVGYEERTWTLRKTLECGKQLFEAKPVTVASRYS